MGWKIKETVKKETKHAFIYLILSTIGSIVDCCVFYWLSTLWLPIIPSNVISYTCWMITSFSLNLRKNFGKSDYIKARFAIYVTISLIWMVLSTSLVYLFIRIIWLWTVIAKILQIIIMAIPLYIANRLITFRTFSKKSNHKNNAIPQH